MTDKNVVLIGFMGSGKSHVAKALAKKLKREVVSTDKLIELQEKKSIPEIFIEFGEKYFRSKERLLIRKISKEKERVIDCGGGIVTDVKNITELKKNGVLFYLSASPEFLLEQISLTGGRPLLQVDDPLAKIKELLNKRKENYEMADHTVISENKSIDKIADEIAEVLSHE